MSARRLHARRLGGALRAQDCELRLLALGEQVEALNGQLAKEKEGRLLDGDAHARFVAVGPAGRRDL